MRVSTMIKGRSNTERHKREYFFVKPMQNEHNPKFRTI